MKEKRCLALFSGGLDSLLAIKVMKNAGIEVIGLNFDTGFFFGAYTEEAGVKKYRAPVPPDYDIRVVDISKEFFEMMKQPKHGFGKHMNPCIDCKIFMIRKAKELLEQYDAGFIITGEVLGQRPMTQNLRSMKTIEADAGVTGYLLRPLCAKNLEMTEPEKLGWVDREKLLDIQGRTRTTQLKLAKDWGLEPFVKPPAGGCILTEEVYSRRLLDHLKHNKEMSREEMKLLNVGRHFRNGSYKFIVGRKESENKELLKLSKNAYVFDALHVPGPIVLTFDDIDEEAKKFIASVTAGYSDANDREAAEVKVAKEGKEEVLTVKPLDKKILQDKNI